MIKIVTIIPILIIIVVVTKDNKDFLHVLQIRQIKPLIWNPFQLIVDENSEKEANNNCPIWPRNGFGICTYINAQ